MPIPVVRTTPPRPATGPGSTPTYGPRRAFGVVLSDRVGRSMSLDTVSTGRSAYVLRPGVTGLDMPPVSLAADALPDEDGALLRALRFVERDIFLPVWVAGTTHEDCRDKARALLSVLNPRKFSDPHDERNVVDLTIAQPDGTRRIISGYYVGGAEGSYSAAEYGVEWRVLGATIRCLDPLWKSVAPPSYTFRTGASAKPFLSATSPFFPVVLGQSQVLGDVTIANGGDRDAFAVWTIVGPGTGFTATNNTTGQTLTLTTDLTGLTVTVDTRRLAQTVADQNGNNLFGDLTGSLWPLVSGANDVTLEVVGATGDTSVTVTVYERWLSA